MTRNDQRRINRTESQSNRGMITRFALRLALVGLVLGVVCLPVAADSV